MTKSLSITEMSPMDEESAALFAKHPASVFLASSLVKLHDQEGFPIEMSLEMAKEKNIRPALLGIVAECASRKMSKNKTKEFVNAWERFFTPSNAESKCIEIANKED